MSSDNETEAATLAQIEADVVDLLQNVERWMDERFLATGSPTALNLEDVAGLITWLQQWHAHFAGYDETGAALAEAGHPTVADRLAAVHAEIDNSVASFTAMAATLAPPPT